jgi:hypothetical protein
MKKLTARQQTWASAPLLISNPAHTYAGKAFKRVFGVSVFKFWEPICGFDLVAFDLWTGTPDGVSCNDHVEHKFGQGAAAIIKALIDHNRAGRNF